MVARASDSVVYQAVAVLTKCRDGADEEKVVCYVPDRCGGWLRCLGSSIQPTLKAGIGRGETIKTLILQRCDSLPAVAEDTPLSKSPSGVTMSGVSGPASAGDAHSALFGKLRDLDWHDTVSTIDGIVITKDVLLSSLQPGRTVSQQIVHAYCLLIVQRSAGKVWYIQRDVHNDMSRYTTGKLLPVERGKEGVERKCNPPPGTTMVLIPLWTDGAWDLFIADLESKIFEFWSTEALSKEGGAAPSMGEVRVTQGNQGPRRKRGAECMDDFVHLINKLFPPRNLFDTAARFRKVSPEEGLLIESRPADSGVLMLWRAAQRCLDGVDSTEPDASAIRRELQVEIATGGIQGDDRPIPAAEGMVLQPPGLTNLRSKGGKLYSCYQNATLQFLYPAAASLLPVILRPAARHYKEIFSLDATERGPSLEALLELTLPDVDRAPQDAVTFLRALLDQLHPAAGPGVPLDVEVTVVEAAPQKEGGPLEQAEEDETPGTGDDQARPVRGKRDRDTSGDRTAETKPVDLPGLLCEARRPTSVGGTPTPPAWLVAAVERFSPAFGFGDPRHKIGTRVTCPRVMSPDSVGAWYDLVGVVTHEGKNIRLGHYRTYSKWCATWYKCDDERVTREEPPDADGGACMLLYEKRKERRQGGDGEYGEATELPQSQEAPLAMPRLAQEMWQGHEEDLVPRRRRAVQRKK
jgi:hypothetical protein